jgi:hypothetical protein
MFNAVVVPFYPAHGTTGLAAGTQHQQWPATINGASAPTSTAARCGRSTSSPLVLSGWNELRPFAWPYREIAMLSKSR